MGSGGMGPGNQFSQYQQSMAQQQMQMGGGPMGPLPTGAMPFQPAVSGSGRGFGGVSEVEGGDGAEALLSCGVRLRRLPCRTASSLDVAAADGC
jgi:hypothetical protein